METIHIKPNVDADGNPLRVRLDNPTELLPAEGAQVPLTPHIIRRINDGSVLVVESATAPSLARGPRLDPIGEPRNQPRKPKE